MSEDHEAKVDAAVAALTADALNAKGFPTVEVSVANLTLTLKYIAALEGVDDE